MFLDRLSSNMGSLRVTETRKTLALLFDVTEAPKFWSKIVVDVVEE